MTRQESLRTIISKNKKQLLFLSILVLAVYANSLNNEFVSDDKAILTTNFADISQTFSQPQLFLRAFFYFVVYSFFGKNPVFFRLLNISFHLLAVWFFYLIVQLLRGGNEALIAASIFAVHPVLVEAVSWISGGGYAQYSAFFLLSLLFYMLSCGSKKYYYLSLATFVMSLLSAEKAFVLGAVFLVYQLSFEEIKKVWKKLLPYLGLSFIWGFYYLGKVGERAALLEEKFYHKVEVGGISLSYALRHTATAITKYFELIFWPQHLTLYQSEVYRSPSLIALSFVVFGGLFLLLIYGFFKNKYLFFCLSLFLISLLPFLTPFGISWWVAERYVYLGSAGIIFLVGLFWGWLLKKFRGEGDLINALIVLIVLSLSVRTVVRNNDWQNEDNLWVATARESPSDPKTHNNMGDYYGRHGNLEKSLEEFKTAIRLKPDYADAYHNLGNTYVQMGRIEEAIDSFERAAELNPNLWQSYQNLGAIYFNQGKYDLAAENFEKALEVNPSNLNLQFNLGIVYLKAGKKEQARKMFLSILKEDPFNQKVLEMLRGLE